MIRRARSFKQIERALDREYRFTSRGHLGRRIPRRHPRPGDRQGSQPGLAQAIEDVRRRWRRCSRRWGRSRWTDKEAAMADRLHRPRQHGRAHGRQPRHGRPRGDRLRPWPAQREGARGGHCLASAAEAARERNSSSPCCRTARSCARSMPRSSVRRARHAADRLLDRRRGQRPRRMNWPPGRGPARRRRAGLRRRRRRGGRHADLHGRRSPEALCERPADLRIMGTKLVHCGDGRRRPGREDLQQHDPRHLDDRRLRGLRAGREARAFAAGAVRRGLDLVGLVLVGQHLLPGAGRRSRPRPPTTTTSPASPPS